VRVFLTAFMLMALAALGLGLMSVHQLRVTARLSDQILADDVRDLAAVHELVIDSEHAARKARTYLLTGEERFLDEYHQMLGQLRQDLDELERVIDSPQGRRQLASIQKHQAAANRATLRALELRRRGEHQASIQLLLQDVQPERDSLDQTFATLLAHKQRRIEEDQQAFGESRRRAYQLIFGGLATMTLLALALGALIWKTAREQREASEFERRLLGIVSHDLRSPLSAVSMSATQLERTELTPSQARATERIQRAVQRMEHLISSLLDFTRIRAGRLQLVCERLCLHELGSRVLEEMRATHPQRAFECDAQGDTCGEWDAARLEQLAINLLDNAVKYSPPDTPIRTVYEDEGEEVLFSVHNQGAPIPKPLLPRLFEPFERGVHKGTKSTSVGLGLYIVRQIAEAHHGSVEVRSTPEDGTTFTVRLPRSPHPHGSRPKSA
jgi:signal transduction histidine kinase